VEVGRRVSQEIPPGMFWRSLLHLAQPQFLKFNISLGKDALFGVYIRKGLPPSHAQVDCYNTHLGWGQFKLKAVNSGSDLNLKLNIKFKNGKTVINIFY
jgi:hypothetical protein